MKNKKLNEMYNQYNDNYKVFNNINICVEVFRGFTNGGFLPIYCNEYCLDFYGYSLEDYIFLKSKDLLIDVHQDDISSLIECFDTAFHKCSSYTNAHRIRNKNNEFVWVYNFGSFHKNEDDSITFFSVFAENDLINTSISDIEEKHFNILSKLDYSKDNVISSIYLNLSKNIYKVHKSDLSLFYPLKSEGNVDLLFNTIIDNIEYGTQKEEFINTFVVDSLINKINEKNDIVIAIPIKTNEKNVTWHNLEMNIVKNPKNGDIEAAIFIENIDQEFRMKKSMERVFQTGFEMVAHIDSKTGLLSYLKAEDEEINVYGNVCDYESTFKKFIQENVLDEFIEECIETLKLSNIIDQINKKKTYSCTFPFKQKSGSLNVICQWRFGYLEGQNRVILITRSNLSRYVNDTVDSLTGLYNKNGFDIAVKKALNNTTRQYQIIRFDFDGFKLVNDQLGFIGGNRFLREFAHLSKKCFEDISSEIVYARFEADHFLMLSPVDGVSVEKVYFELDNILNSFVDISRLQVRIGVYRIFDTSIDTIVMCDNALLALRSIKGSFSNHISFYNQEIKNKVIEENFITSEMKASLDKDEFEVWFQPQIDHETKQIVGAEALVRWFHPDKGYISPGIFIPLFEKNDFVYELDKYVLEKSCEFIRKMIDDNEVVVPISVNISRFDLVKVDFFNTIINIVNKYQIPFNMLHLEITESAFIDIDGMITRIVNRLIDYGFKIAIDDFGSGYSSLSMLQSVPAHILKLDMSFFGKSENKQRNNIIVEAIIKMAQNINMNVIAEGVESIDEADNLLNCGCKYIQGYVYSKPLPVNDFKSFIKNNDCKQIKNNIDDKLKGNDTLEELKEFYNRILDESDDSILICEEDSKKVLYANEVAEKEYNKKFDSRIGLKCFEYSRNLSKECIDCPLKNNDNKKINCTYESNGVNYHYNIARLNFKEKKLFISIKKKETLSLINYLSSTDIVENIPGALIIYKELEKGVYKRTFFSKKAQELFNVSVNSNKESLLENDLTTINVDDIDKMKDFIVSVSNSSTSKTEEFRITDFNGNDKWIEVNTSSIMAPDGNHQYYCIFTDVTESVNKRLNEQIKHEKRFEIYHKMIEDSNIDDNEDLLERIEYDIDDNRIISTYYNEKECFEYKVNSFYELINKISETCLSEKDKKSLLFIFRKHIEFVDIHDSGYASTSFEYLRITKFGRICWVRTELKSYIDPFTNHINTILLTFESGKKKFPQALLTRFLSKEVEIISLYNLKSLVGQSYFINRNYNTIDRIVNNQIENIVFYANNRIEESKRNDFLQAVSLDNVIKHLNNENDIYRCSFWADYNGEKHRKTWVFSYIDEYKDGLFITRMDTTKSYIEEEKEKSKLEDALNQIELSKYDGLTGIYNRSASIKKIEELIKKPGENYRALVMLDLDNLKHINDTFGHLEGDKALTLLSEVLRNNVIDGIVGRVGGDEFVIYYNNVVNEKEITKKLSTLLSKINNVTLIEHYNLRCSVGCVIDKSRTKSFQWMYRRADRSLYAAKNKGKNCFDIYKYMNE